MEVPYVLTVAGHDPCGGAGLTSDIKTFKTHDVYGLSVATALTIQNDNEFVEVDWVDNALIVKQIRILLTSYPVDVVKVGIIKDLSVLVIILTELKRINPNIKVIWDPIIKSSSGFEIQTIRKMDKKLLSQLYLITPNINEFETLKSFDSGLNKCNWLIKGGHNLNNRGTDTLVTAGGKFEIEGESFNGKSKHGTGCVLSSSIVAYLAKGESLIEACRLGKKYVERFILSDDGNLGIHHHIQY